MRKLSAIEEAAYQVLCDQGSIHIGADDLQPISRTSLLRIMDALVKKKRATVEATDDGPRYHPVGAP